MGDGLRMSRLLLREIAYNYDAEAGASSESWVLEPETFGPPGETIPIPGSVDDIDVVGKPPHRPIRWTQYDPRRRACFPVYLLVERMNTFLRQSASSPTWDIFSEWGTVWPMRMALDPTDRRNKLYIAYGEYEVPGWYVYEFPNGAPSKTLILSPIDIDGIHRPNNGSGLCVSPSIPGGLWVSTEIFDTKSTYVAYRHSHTDTFHISVVKTVVSEYSVTSHGVVVGSGSSSPPSAVVYAAASCRDPADAHIWIMKSNNGGATWAEDVDIDIAAIDTSMHVTDMALAPNVSGDTQLFVGTSDYTSTYGLLRRDAAGNYTTISSNWSATSISICEADRNYLCCVGQSAVDAHTRLYYSTNNGNTWDTTPLPGAQAYDDNLVHVRVWPYSMNGVLIIINQGLYSGVWITSNFLTGTPTWHNISGNLVLPARDCSAHFVY